MRHLCFTIICTISALIGLISTNCKVSQDSRTTTYKFLDCNARSLNENTRVNDDETKTDSTIWNKFYCLTADMKLK